MENVTLILQAMLLKKGGRYLLIIVSKCCTKEVIFIYVSKTQSNILEGVALKIKVYIV